jgi:hypothetical protein
MKTVDQNKAQQSTTSSEVGQLRYLEAVMKRYRRLDWPLKCAENSLPPGQGTGRS